MNKKIYLTENNKSKVEAVLNDVQKRARVRTVDVDEVYEAAKWIEEKLCIPKKHMEGIVATVDMNAQSFPNSYKYMPESTIFVLERKNNKWALTNCYRGECRPNPDKRFSLKLTEKARECIIRNHEQFYC